MEAKQRIAIFSPFYPPFEGGAERVAQRTATLLGERGHQVEVHTLRHDVSLKSTTFDGNITVHRYPFGFVRALGFTTARSPGFVAAAGNAAVDVVHIHSTTYPMLLAQVAGRSGASGKRTMIITHGIFEAIMGNHRGARAVAYRALMSSILRRLFKRVDAVGASSKFDLELLASVGIVPRASAILPNGVDLPSNIEFQGVNSTSSRTHIAHVASIKPNKGHLDMLVALKRLTCQGEYLYHIVGSGGTIWSTFEATVQGRVKQLGLQDSVTFHGRVDDDERDRIYRLADVVVVPSRAETFPLSVLEGMSYAKAVVATDVGGVRDMISTGSNGLLVPAGFPDALAEAISSLEDPGLRQRIGTRARQRTEQAFTWDKVIDRYEALSLSLSGV